MNYEKFAVFFSRVGAYLWLRLGLYGYISQFYCFFFEDKAKRAPVKYHASLQALADYVKTLKWRSDTWRELWDTFSTPEHGQWIADHQQENLAFDCDDFARYEATAVLNGVNSGNKEWFDVKGAYILNVMWRTKKGKNGGHNVCLLNTKEGWRYMDYGNPSEPVPHIRVLVDMVITRYAKGATVLAYGGIRASDLKTIFVVSPPNS
jgi:hypothetical protein